MDLTARDIHEKQFHDAWRGYNQEEVDDFLDRIAEVLDRVQRENETLQKRVNELDSAVSASRDTEEMLKKTLVSAQQAAEEAIATAKAKASELITEAEERARRSIEEATERVQSAEAEARRKTLEAEREHHVKRTELDSNIERLQTLENELKGRIKGFLEQQAQMLQGLDITEQTAGAAVRGPGETKPSESQSPVAGQAAPAPATGETAPAEAPPGDAAAQSGTEEEGSGTGPAVASAGDGPNAVVTLPEASANGSNGGGSSSPAGAAAPTAGVGHGRRGVKGLFWRDES
jgi:cell division initiation protein